MEPVRIRGPLGRLPRMLVLWALERAGYGLVQLNAPNPYPFTLKQFEVASRLSGSRVLDLLPHCHAKDGQDLLAAALNDFEPGFFVDIGAFDGRTGSNTHLLETRLGWSGLLVEPNPDCLTELRNERSTTIDTRAIGASDGVTVTLELDGQKSRLRTDGQGAARTAAVRTATAETLFRENAVPEHVHYVSIDVEGLESVVLRSLPFERHTIDLVSVEHNYDAERRAEIRAFLAERDYVTVHESLSRNEDWFVRRPLADHPCLGR